MLFLHALSVTIVLKICSPLTQLRKAYPSLKLPTLPSTRWLVRSFDKDYLEKKQAKLQRYVAELLACSPKIIRNADVQLFLTGNHKVCACVCCAVGG